MVELLGYENYKDAPPVAYTRWTNTGSIPQHLATLQDGNGKWWEMAPSGDFFDVRWFGAKLNGVANDRTALEKAIATASPQQVVGGGYYRIRKVFIPEGILKVSGADIYVRGVTIEGTTAEGSIILGQIGAGESLFIFDGGAGVSIATANGGLRRLTILNGVNFIGDSAVRVYGGPLTQAYDTVFEDLKITGLGLAQGQSGVGGRWKIPIVLDGSAGTAAPKGLRRATLRNIFLGNPDSYGLMIVSAGDVVVDNVSVYGGTELSQSFYIWGSVGNESNGIQFLGCDVDTYLWVYDCIGFAYFGKAKYVVFGPRAVGCGFYGVQSVVGVYHTGGVNYPAPTGNVNNAAGW